MFEAALETVLDALKPRLQAGEKWRASAAALHTLIAAKRPPTDAASTGQSPVFDGPKPTPNAVSEKPPADGTPRRSGDPAGWGEVPRDTENRLKRFRELEQKTAACRTCSELAGSRTHVVQGGFHETAEILFVEDAPTGEQDAAGHVAAGEASELLDKMLKAMGLTRSEVSVVNVLRCMPPRPAGESVPRRPHAAELDACRTHVEELVDIVQPRVIVALGAGAARGLLGTQEPVARLRSQWHAFRGIPVMPTFHPAYLIENPDISNKRKVWEDLLLVMEKLELPISAKQRAFFLR